MSENEQMRTIEYRDIRPDGTLLTHWLCPENQELAAWDYGRSGPGMLPKPPWDTQRREPGGEWVTTRRMRSDEQRTWLETLAPDGTVTLAAEWWE